MLDKETAAEVIRIKYPYSEHFVRFHKHTEDGSIWIVLADICQILNLTNVSYTAGKLPPEAIYKHKILTDGGKQVVTWAKYEAIIGLGNKENNQKLIDFIREINFNLKNAEKPIVIEQSLFLRLLSIVNEIESKIMIK